jgi:Ca-activated chloride channel family protein
MQRFQYGYLLNLLWLIIPLIAVVAYYMRWQLKTEKSVFKSNIVNHILPHRNALQDRTKLCLFFMSIVFLILAIANPQIGMKGEKIKGQGLDIMLLLDVSNSMLAEDIQPNRISRSKFFITKFLDQLKHDRVGLVLFAGSSYLQVPLTIDFTSIKLSMPIIDPANFPSQGTNIGEAVTMAGNTLGLAESKSKAIVIITDGEDHDQEASAAIETARKNGIKVFAIGVGEEKGAPIPVGNGEYKKDENGNIVMTSFNRSVLENLASIGNGSFYHLGQQGDIVEDVVAELNKLEGKDFEDFDMSNFNSYFYWFALAALLLFFVEFMLPSLDYKQFLKNISSIVFLILFSFSATAQTKEIEAQYKKSRTLIRNGNSSYQNNNFDKAELNYRKALVIDPKSKSANYNLGNTLYSQQKFQESQEYYEKSIDKNDDKLSRARAYHNIGNTCFKSNQLEQAILAYENALKINPSDMETKYNLAMAKKQQQNKGGGKNDQKQDKKDNQNKKDDQKKSGGNGNPQEKPEEAKSEPKPDNKSMSKEQAQRLLEALKNQEQNTQNKMEAKKTKPEPKKGEKDW